MKHKLTFPSLGLMFAFAATICLPLNLIQAQEEAPENDGPKLTIGSEAPDLDIEHWVSDNDGSFEHVTKFEKGKIYVVEFWATWCQPCIAQMPHLADLQKKFADQGVQVISVSDEEIDTVEEFLDRPVRGDDQERSYRELTGTYCLTADPDKSVWKDYLLAAEQGGIPCVFIVGKTGLVEWIGHPGLMDKPLKQIVNDKWDRDEALVAFNKANKQMKQRRLLTKAVQTLNQMRLNAEDEEAIEYLSGLINNEEYEFAKGILTTMRLQLMVLTGHADAASALIQFTKENRENSMALNEVAWGIYEQHEAQGDVSREVLVAAKATAEAAVKAEPDSDAILDTLAHYIYVVDGDLDKAIEIQKKAVELAGDRAAEIKPFLDQLLKEKETGKKPKKKRTGTDF